jgi:hypothetical protein
MERIMSIGTIAAASLCAAATAGNYTSYFGEDLNFGGQGTSLFGQTLTNTRAAQNQFLNRLDGNSVEGFESFGLGAQASPIALSFLGSAGTIGASLSGSPLEVRAGAGIAGDFATEGNQYLFSSVAAGSVNSFTINFDQAVAAFGFVGSDIGDIGAVLTLELANGGTTQINVGNSIAGPNGEFITGSALFFGLVAEDMASLFTSIRFDFDEMTVGDMEQVNPIPLPTAGALGLMGITAIGARRRRASH